jgi:uncharacterized membrane protein
MGKSAKLVLISFKHTFLIAMLMILIAMRVIINILAVIIVPTLMFLAAGFVATVTLAKVGFIIAIIVGVFGLFVAAYFGGILNVFSNTVWTYTYLALLEEPHVKEIMGE